VATKKPTLNSFPAQSPTERIAETQNNTCPHRLLLCPICRAEDDLLQIFRAPKPRLFSMFRFGGAR
jgi:hypothetical protein